jgi:hypothetical protein
MAFDAIFKWLIQTPFAVAIHEGETIFPWIESFHVLAITLVVGSIAIVDLRLLGFASLDRAVRQLTREVLPCTWAAFAVAVITGIALFASNAVNYAHNFAFQGKLVLLLLAGLNMLAFHLWVGRDIDRWESRSRTPIGAKIAAALSLSLWVGVVGFGRWIGFTLLPTMAG